MADSKTTPSSAAADTDTAAREETAVPAGAAADAGADAAANAGDELAGVDFESALEELETLVGQMEGGDLSLEASLAAFERGVRLTRHCQGALKEAELKVKVLTEQNTLEDLDIEALDDT